tara:strand:- start:764 stop:1282 length:519 start_codon:yes stop_codon:yes gene_type:complete
MKILKTKFKDLIIINSKNFYDNRGYFREILIEKIIKKKFKFNVVSKSKKNVIRGLHMQRKNPQGKYISVIKGSILDVVVDCRKNSKTFGKHYKVIISDKNAKSIYVPPGFIHGFVGLKKENLVLYSCTNYRDKNSEFGVIWNDKDLKINWGVKNPILSSKDRNNLKFKDIKF